MVVIFILYNNYAHSNKEDKVWFRRTGIMCSGVCTNMQVMDLVKGEQTMAKGMSEITRIENTWSGNNEDKEETQEHN